MLAQRPNEHSRNHHLYDLHVDVLFWPLYRAFGAIAQGSPAVAAL